jgi:hypothetical protein
MILAHNDIRNIDDLCIGEHIIVNLLNTVGPFSHAKYLSKLFVSGVFHKKHHFQCAFDNNVCSIHLFTEQIFGAAKKTPPSPAHPTALRRGRGSS